MEKKHLGTSKSGFNALYSNAYSAEDIARILVRNPDEIVDLLTYERICDIYAQGRAVESLSENERQIMLSLDAAIDELSWLGFDDARIDAMVHMLRESFEELDIQSHKPDYIIKTPKERLYMTAFTIAAFPYGPPIILFSPHHAMTSYGFSATQSRNFMHELTSRLSLKLMTHRTDNPAFLSVTHAPQSTFSRYNAEISPEM